MIDLKTMYPAQVNSPYTTTLGEISTSDTSLVVADVSVLPAQVPFLLTLGYDKSASETVLVTAVSGNTLTIVRGVDGDALLWVAGTKAARIFTAKDLNDVQDNISALNEGKQDNLTLDTAPVEGSGNPITSGGVQTALAEVGETLEGKQDALTFDPTPTPDSTNPVTSGGVSAALGEIAEAVYKIGDIKTSLAVQDETWLSCDGSGISAEQYPELASLLNQKYSYQSFTKYLHQEFDNNGNGYDINPIGVHHTSGRTMVIIQPRYYIPTSSSYYYKYKPVSIYIKYDKYVDWRIITFTDHSDFIANGYYYNSSKSQHYIYGYVKVSDEETYPAIIYSTTDGWTTTWTFKQLSTTYLAKVVTTGNIGTKQYVFVRSNDYSTQYCYSGTTAFMLAEVQLASGAPMLSNVYSADGKLFYRNGTTLYYTTDPTQSFSSITLPKSGTICYGGGTMVLCSLVNYSASFYFADDYLSGSFQQAELPAGFNFSDWSLKQVVYVNGAFVAEIRRVPGGTRCLLVSTDQGRTWKERSCVNGLYPTNFYVYGSSLFFAEMYKGGVFEWSHLEADATLPLITSDNSTVYIKGK